MGSRRTAQWFPASLAVRHPHYNYSLLWVYVSFVFVAVLLVPVAGSPDTVLDSVRMDKLAKKKALAAKKTFFTKSRPTLTGIQHLFPSKSEAVLLKEAGVSASKGPTATCECPAFEYPAFACIYTGCTSTLVGQLTFPYHRRRWSRWRACRTDRLCFVPFSGRSCLCAVQ